MIFKGGTSLSKVWNQIERFSEDIDLAIDSSVLGIENVSTKKQIKKLRKASSIFVREDFFSQISEAFSHFGIADKCTIEAEPDGTGNDFYPEPRKIFIKYKSSLPQIISYISPTVMLEISARSLIEPNKIVEIESMAEKKFPHVSTSLTNSKIPTALVEKTFLEKVFLLHELFSVEGQGTFCQTKIKASLRFMANDEQRFYIVGHSRQ